MVDGRIRYNVMGWFANFGLLLLREGTGGGGEKIKRSQAGSGRGVRGDGGSVLRRTDDDARDGDGPARGVSEGARGRGGVGGVGGDLRSEICIRMGVWKVTM